VVADLYLEIEELNEKIKKLTQEIVQLKQPNGLELAMRDEADKYGFVLFNN
jgi:FtsZ-binding cell division protein ZapB